MIDFEFLLLYGSLFLICWWLYLGYLIFIYVHSSLSGKKISPGHIDAEKTPYVAMIIPCYNEEQYIEQKIKNCLALDYQKNKIFFIFADGRSTDRTQEVIQRHMQKNKQIKILISEKRGKISQLNCALHYVNTELSTKKILIENIVISDCDALLKKNAVTVLASYLALKKIGVVGISSKPERCMKEERYFWAQQNRLRLAESVFYSPSYVIATCYGFRKDLLFQFPEDVIADDIYMSFYAIAKKYRNVYTDDSTVIEIRNPTTTKELMYHKIRKTNAFLIELKRYFIPFLNNKGAWQLIFYTRFLQMTIAPFLALFLLFVFIYLAFTSLTKLLPLLSLCILVFTYLLIRPEALRGLSLKLKTFVLLHLVLYYCILTFPFYRQNSAYKKTK